ncbi:MAG: phosphate signaling complex protein PhoU [Clostridia bacterium]|nr:phosphate signaling complex protein PhoU [Clostridia bacterium]
MRDLYNRQLRQLNGELIHMGEMIEKAISSAVSALVERDDQKAREIIAFDDEIDQQERLIESMCMKLLLAQQPVAGDLRMVSSALKVITDMERIGDHAADISEIELMLDQLPPMTNESLRRMATETSVMLMRSIESFAERDQGKALWVIEHDDVVDGLFVTVKRELIEAIRERPENGECAADLLMAAKYFERIGDHATNIAEWAIYAITGEHARGTDEGDPS